MSEFNERSADIERARSAMGKGMCRHEYRASIIRMGSLTGKQFWVTEMQGSSFWLSTYIFGIRRVS